MAAPTFCRIMPGQISAGDGVRGRSANLNQAARPHCAPTAVGIARTGASRLRGQLRPFPGNRACPHAATAQPLPAPPHARSRPCPGPHPPPAQPVQPPPTLPAALAVRTPCRSSCPLARPLATPAMRSQRQSPAPPTSSEPFPVTHLPPPPPAVPARSDGPSHCRCRLPLPWRGCRPPCPTFRQCAPASPR
jgi:hypothetical protein